MNEAEKEILQSSLSEEEKVLKFLKRTYERAKKECIEKIAQLSEKESLNPANLQSIIYQKKYQEVLLMQINSTLSNLQTDNYKTIDDYLNKCYEEGFTGALYSINKQGIPIIAPIDNKQVIQAIYNDTKLSQGLYERLGENIEELKISIKSNVSRGIVEGKSWTEVASGIANDMNTPFKKAMNNAMRIARTEGGRVQQQAQMDACRKAVARGADIVKQWDSTLDGRTRDSHRAMDGEVRELEEKFSNGLLHPKDKNGSAAEVVNCRCVMLQRARWALGVEELKALEEKARFHGFVDEDGNITSKSFNDFKKMYDKSHKNVELPQELSEKKEIDDRIISEINAAFKEMEKEYDIYKFKISYEALGEDLSAVPMQFQAEKISNFAEYRLIINKNFNFDDLTSLNTRIEKRYNEGRQATKNVKDLVYHELAHLMTFQDCFNWSSFENRSTEFFEDFVGGVSQYADKSRDTAETIAEAFVLYKRGEKLPDNIVDLLNDYVLRWKK